MASPFGGIDPDILKQIQALMQTMGPSAEDKASARQHAMLTAGLGMMQNANLNPVRAIGMGGLLGAGSYNDELKQIAAQRGASMQQAMQYQTMLQQMANNKRIADALNDEPGGVPQVGPPQSFQAPGGAAALMNAGAAGQAPDTSMLPTRTFGPPNPMAKRNALANANILSVAGGGKDLSAAIKLKYPDIIPLRAGAGAYDPATGTITPNPVAPPGYYYDAGSNSYIKVKNGAEAEAAAQSIPKAVDLAYKPQIGVLPGGGEGVVGSQLQSLFGNGPLPYNAPQPYVGKTQAAVDAGQLPPKGVSMRDWLAAKADAANNPDSVFVAADGTQTPMPTAPQRQYTQTKLSPEQEAQSKNLGEYEQKIHDSATTAGTSQAKLNTLTTMFDRFTPGPTMPIRSGIASYAQEVPGLGRIVADALVPNSAQALPAIAAVKKLAVEMTAEQSKVFGSREGQQVIGMIKSALPSIESVPGAPQIIMQSLSGLNQYHIDTEKALAAWKADPSHNGSVEGFQEAWNATNPPSKYVPMDKLTAIVGGAPAQSGPIQLSPKAQSNTTARMMVQQVLKSGDPAKIQELRTLGWIQ